MLLATATRIRERVATWIGLPVQIGIGPPKTLAKTAQHHAKAHPELAGRRDLTGWEPAAVDELLASLPVSDVWGIGGRLTARLAPLGIRTTLDLARADPRQMRRLFSVVVERTASELRGVPCIEFGPDAAGYSYIRAMVMLTDLAPAGSQPHLWADPDRPDDPIPTLIDRINHRHGHGLIGYSAAGLRRHRPWSMRRKMLSPHYTTRWDQLLDVTA